jgi:hypothetical protein
MGNGVVLRVVVVVPMIMDTCKKIEESYISCVTGVHTC